MLRAKGFEVARPEGFEPPAFWFVARRSIQLSYGRARGKFYHVSQTAARFAVNSVGLQCNRGLSFLRKIVFPETF